MLAFTRATTPPASFLTRTFASLPTVLPLSPEFSSGPCKKFPGYNLSSLPNRNFGRSHRSSVGKATLKHAIDESKRLLNLPEGFRLGIVPASDTGAYEMAMWNFLGHPEGVKEVDVLHWESFGKGWWGDVDSHLQRGKGGADVEVR